MPYVYHLALLAAETTLVSGVLLLLYHLRGRLGLIPLAVAVGTFQYLQGVLALSVYVEIAPGISVSPGSSVLFTAGLFAVLLIYIEEDALEARKLIYGLLLANVALSLLSLLVGLHIAAPGAANPYALPRELFLQNPRIMMVGTVVLFIDVVAVILVFEAVSRVITRPLAARLFVSMVLVLALDTVLFTTGAFLGQPGFGDMLLSGFVGKAIAAALYTGFLTFYIHYIEPPSEDHQGEVGVMDVFGALTYRQRYERALQQAIRDSLTGLFNRRYLDSYLKTELERAHRYETPTSLLLIDADRFKAINDQWGHQEGDRAIQFLAKVLQESVRGADVVARFGGEEFAAVLPHTDRPSARLLAERIRDRLAAACKRSEASWTPMTVTIGLATFPDDATDIDALVHAADQRLYAGKAAGRDRVVAASAPIKQ